MESLHWDDLPPPNITRWVPRKKAAVVAAVDNGLLTLREAMSRYSLSLEEFVGWQHAIHTHGLMGLRANCPAEAPKKAAAGSRGIEPNDCRLDPASSEVAEVSRRIELEGGVQHRAFRGRPLPFIMHHADNLRVFEQRDVERHRRFRLIVEG